MPESFYISQLTQLRQPPSAAISFISTGMISLLKMRFNDLHSFIVCDADTILILHRLPYFVSLKNKSNGIEDGDLACIVAKNLHGEIGTVPLSWDAEHLRFG